jgi:elongation factor Ts
VTTIPASLVKELHDLTGAGVMDCKRALEEAGGDLEAAQRIIREQETTATTRQGEKTDRLTSDFFGYFGLPRRFLRACGRVLRAILPHY